MMPWPPREGNEPLDWGDEPIEPPPPPSAGRSIRLGFLAAYDYAGSSIAASLLGFIVLSTVAWVLLVDLKLWTTGFRQASILGLGLFVLLAPLLLSPFAAGLYNLARAMFTRDDPHVLDILRGAVKYVRPAMALGYTQILVTTVLLCDITFLLNRPGAVFKVMAVLLGYFLLFWAMMLSYQWPLLIEQRKPLKTTLIRSFLLAAHNPLYTLAITLFILAFVGLPVYCFHFPSGPAALIPVSLLWTILIGTIHTSATLEILRRYPDPE